MSRNAKQGIVNGSQLVQHHTPSYMIWGDRLREAQAMLNTHTDQEASSRNLAARAHQVAKVVLPARDLLFDSGTVHIESPDLDDELCPADVPQVLNEVDAAALALFSNVNEMPDDLEAWMQKLVRMLRRDLADDRDLAPTTATSVKQVDDVMVARYGLGQMVSRSEKGADATKMQTMDLVMDLGAASDQPLDRLVEGLPSISWPDSAGFAASARKAQAVAQQLKAACSGEGGACAAPTLCKDSSVGGLCTSSLVMSQVEVDTASPPPDWECDPSLHNDGRCDCDCGAWDPDCDAVNGRYTLGIFEDDNLELLDEARGQELLRQLDASKDGHIDAEEFVQLSVLGAHSQLRPLARKVYQASQSGAFHSMLWFAPSRCAGSENDGSDSAVGSPGRRGCRLLPTSGLERVGLLSRTYASYEVGCVKDTRDAHRPRGVCAVRPTLLSGVQCSAGSHTPVRLHPCGGEGNCIASESNSWDLSCAKEDVLSTQLAEPEVVPKSQKLQPNATELKAAGSPAFSDSTAKSNEDGEGSLWKQLQSHIPYLRSQRAEEADADRAEAKANAAEQKTYAVAEEREVAAAEEREGEAIREEATASAKVSDKVSDDSEEATASAKVSDRVSDEVSDQVILGANSSTSEMF